MKKKERYEYNDLLKIMSMLRLSMVAPGTEQDHKSLKRYLIEEA